MIRLFRAETKEQKEACDLFLLRHHPDQQGSTAGYRAYFAAYSPAPGRPLVDTLVAVAKVCPMHTPSAADFFYGGPGGKSHVYILQRLAAFQAPENTLTQLISFCLREMGKDERIHYVSSYADTGHFNAEGRPHDGGIYRICHFIYCGMTDDKKKLTGFILDGKKHHIRKGGKTMRKRDIPAEAKLIYAYRKHRYCKAVGPRLKRSFRQIELVRRMAKYQFEAVYQPKLMIKLREVISWLKSLCQVKKSLKPG